MRVVFVFFAVFAASACCLAADGAALAPSGVSTVKLSWETLVTIYGPMAGVILWFMWQEKSRMKNDVLQRDRLIALAETCAEAITSVNATLVQVRAEASATSERNRAENEKNRTAIYRLAEEVHDLRPAASGNTRVKRRDGGE